MDDERAFTTAVRVSRDLAADAHLGMIYTGRTVTPSRAMEASLSFRPMPAFTIDTTYLWTQLSGHAGAPAIFSDHLLRSRWNYQLTKRLSARLIVSADRLSTV